MIMMDCTSSIDQEQANKLIEIQNSTSLTNEEVLTALESGQTVGHESEKYRAENAIAHTDGR
jgi:hypothetical protein